jgi:hypothetical protein
VVGVLGWLAHRLLGDRDTRPHTTILGGQGGQAPGAAGGGGAAIGRGARGGPGGPVGPVQLDGLPGHAPGSGGGGGGAIMPSSRSVTAADLKMGFRISGAYLCHYGCVRHETLDLLGAGWEWIEVPTFPSDVQMGLVCTACMKAPLPQTNFALLAVVGDAHGTEVLRKDFTISSGLGGAVMVRHYLTSIQFTANHPGVWRVMIKSGKSILAELPVEVRLRTRAQ